MDGRTAFIRAGGDDFSHQIGVLYGCADIALDEWMN